MIFCGVDVGLHRQHLCTLDAAGHATHHPPGSVAEVAAAIGALGDVVVGIDAPAAGTLGLLADDGGLRDRLGIAGGRYRTARVSDWQLVRRGVPLYPVPPAGAEPSGWQAWMARGYELHAALGRRFAPPADPACEGPADLAHGRVFETYPDAVFLALLGARPPRKRTAEGAAARERALRAAGVDDAGATHDARDACAAALTARLLAQGAARWYGHPAEGVIVLPPLSPARARPSSRG